MVLEEREENNVIPKSIISDTEWAETLQKMLESTGEAGIFVRYKALGVTFVASGCQLAVNERKILTIPPPAKPLGQMGSALDLELPDLGDDQAAYYRFEDENSSLYLSAKWMISDYPENYAQLEFATTSELLDDEVNAPLIH